MASILDYVYVAAILIVAVAGVFYMMWTGTQRSSDAGSRGDYLRAVAVAVFLVYMAGTLVFS